MQALSLVALGVMVLAVMFVIVLCHVVWKLFEIVHALGPAR